MKMKKITGSEYTSKEYWESYWENEQRGNIQFYFDELMNQYISWESVNSYMEIGGAPGSVMAYMSKKHNLVVSTVDFTDEDRITRLLSSRGIENFCIYQDDFLTMDIEAIKHKFDIVASWGFIEHFKRKAVVRIVNKQKDLVSENGYLVVELPNIRKVFWLIYRIFNKDMIKIHNLKIMDLEWLKRLVTYDGRFELLYASYYFTMNPQNEYFVKHRLFAKICGSIVRFFNKRKVSDNVKRWFYPYIVIIGKRK